MKERTADIIANSLRIGGHSFSALITGVIAKGCIVSDKFNQNVAAIGGDETTGAIIAGLLTLGFTVAATDGVIDLENAVFHPNYPEK
ncbi:MAG: hypothetical protein DHS20C02_04790 [Micavibrio sp.]|nr:MAG: hypothetical protein DHS20C02_04790 [Micavibrio sp.]